MAMGGGAVTDETPLKAGRKARTPDSDFTSVGLLARMPRAGIYENRYFKRCYLKL